MKKIITIIPLLLVLFQVEAQQDAQYTHYMYNTLAVNPAYAIISDFSATALIRTQWVGFKGAPRTQSLTTQGKIGENTGLGLSFVNDKIGPIKNTSLAADFAYGITINRKSVFSLGLKAGFSMRSESLGGLTIIDETDQSLTTNVSSDFLPNVGFGVYYQYNNQFYAGLSIPKMLENDFSSSEASGFSVLSNETRHYYLTLGGEIALGNSSGIYHRGRKNTFKPSALIKLTPGAPLDLDLSAIFSLKSGVWLGLMARVGDGFGALVGYKLKDGLSIGYSFDASLTNKTGDYNAGSHEIMLSYVLESKKKSKRRKYGRARIF